MKITQMEIGFDCKTYEIARDDYLKAGSSELSQQLFGIFLIREFENTLLSLSADGCIHGPVHTSIGHEACAAGAMAALKPGDKIASTHRAHHHYLTKIFSCYRDKFDPLTDDLPDFIQSEITSLMGEIMGLSIGCCGGRGGSMHLRNKTIGVVGTNAIVAGGVPLATGAAFACKAEKKGDVVVCFLGDGAVNQGAFHEAVNLAGIWQLPIVYFIENNLYAVATSIKETTATHDLAVKAVAYGLKSSIVDGMDPVAVRAAMKDAVNTARQKGSATIIEAKCYRFPHHAGPIAGSSFNYRSRQEEDKWKTKDAYEAFPEKLIELGILTQEQVDNIKSKAVDTVQQACGKCATSKDGKLHINEDLQPKVELIETGLRSNGDEFAEITFSEKSDFEKFRQVSYSDAIAAVTGRWLEKDDKVFVLGEEIANFGGGPYGATKGLLEKYKGRILNTPISEAGFSGLAGGAAMSGMKPIVEIMFPDFALVAADQLFNQIGKLRHIYGNTTDMPLVVRTRIAIGCGYGGQHSMDPVGLFSLFSGWHVVTPSNAFDYVGLFNSAMQSKDPVVIVEHHQLYPCLFNVPQDNLDYFIELGKAAIIKPGSDVTVLCYSSTADLCLKAAKELARENVSAEVIDLRTVSPGDIDYETIGESLKKTGTIIIVEQAPKSLSIGAKIAEQVQRRFFDYLDGPIETVAGLDIPLPVSKTLEAYAIPDLDSVKSAITKTAKRKI